MRRELHIISSIKRLGENYPEFYRANSDCINEFIEELHLWFDKFAVAKGDEIQRLRHREKRHHKEGIEEISEKLTKKYGKEFKEIVRQEATEHVRADMYFIPKQSDYTDKYFWDIWIAKYETISSWV